METKKLKLKTKLDFIFDTTEIEEDISYDVEFKEKKLRVIKEVQLPSRIRVKRMQDASTKLF